MARLDDNQKSILADYWNILAHEATLGTTVTDLQAIARAVADLAGNTLSFADNQAIAVLYGYARRMDNAATQFQGASLQDVITPDMIGVPPWARDEQVMNTSPLFHATFEFTFLDQAGNVVTEFRTSAFAGQLPGTVGQLTDDIQADAEAMAAKYEVQLLQVNPIQLLAV